MVAMLGWRPLIESSLYWRGYSTICSLLSISYVTVFILSKYLVQFFLDKWLHNYFCRTQEPSMHINNKIYSFSYLLCTIHPSFLITHYVFDWFSVMVNTIKHFHDPIEILGIKCKKTTLLKMQRQYLIIST